MQPESPLAIEVDTQYVADQSEPAKGRYLFHYTIAITNVSEHSLTLKRRHWLITDGNGEQMEVEGAGVVGETPTLVPGQAFRYTSSVVLPTPLGSMMGHYTLEGGNGAVRAPIPRFRLSMPGALH
ncbi:Co2+/Mg2+ efflux protein ApaG [Ferrimonas balearica]|uniref:Co2+/Mg2+ efflux protein ApaG n=1 Tax=Ferrimonas balearica TaxID=44012 RepID=UPI001C98F08A|nr:Co2+/Mg2+ efflux protein ApaG [Ferrimonas balearica]MBY5993021.1 Co2+/Mg2+ efflux protein ApaG [Ferrimonas balearica]